MPAPASAAAFPTDARTTTRARGTTPSIPNEASTSTMLKQPARSIQTSPSKSSTTTTKRAPNPLEAGIPFSQTRHPSRGLQSHFLPASYPPVEAGRRLEKPFSPPAQRRLLRLPYGPPQLVLPLQIPSRTRELPSLLSQKHPWLLLRRCLRFHRPPLLSHPCRPPLRQGISARMPLLYFSTAFHEETFFPSPRKSL